MIRRARHYSQRGVSLVETLIAIPVLWLIIGGAIELGLLFEAKATLNHAVLQAARAGMVNNASPTSMNDGLSRGLLPLYSPPSNLAGVAETLSERVLPDVLPNTCMRIINPTREAFNDFQEIIIGAKIVIPNDELHRQPTALGANSGINLQDANLLKVYVTYGAPLRIPIVGPLIAQTLLLSGKFDGFERALLEQERLPIVASATVRAQTPIQSSSLIASRQEVLEGPLCTSNLLSNIPLISEEAEKCLLEASLSNPEVAVDCVACVRSRGFNPKACLKCGSSILDFAKCVL